ncbi:MAG: sugar-binding transcriptional regulator [Thermoflexales bacterium]
MKGAREKANRDEMLVRAAWMYYDEGLTHEQIARKLRLSRVSVTRLLKRARSEGIVEIRLTRPAPLHYRLERQLQAALGLQDVIVVSTRATAEETLDEVGRAGLMHLLASVQVGYRIGVGWSTTVAHIAPHIQPLQRPPACTVNELIGTMAGHANPYSISAPLAQALSARLESLPVPAVVQNPAARAALLAEERVYKALEQASRCDLAVVGLGEVGPECTLVRLGYLTAAQMHHLQQHGAVGDALMQFYDDQGKPVTSPLQDRLIALSLADLQRIPYVIALAAGPKKVLPIIGAAKGKLIHCLVTDVDTAQAVLKHLKA